MRNSHESTVIIEQPTESVSGSSGRAANAVSSAAVATVELDALWASFWEDRSRCDVRTQLAQAYEFVIPCVIRTLGRGFKSYWEKGELHALGYIGLLQSIDNFAPGSVAGQFPAYATPRVRGVIMDELRHLDFFPRAMRENVNRIKEATERLTTERGEQPSRATIADAAGLSHEQGEKVLAAMHSIYFLHLDQHVSRQGSELPASETIPTADPGPEAKVLEASNRDELIEALLELPPRERAALSFRYFGKLTQIQIAGMLGVSHSRICQIEKNALDHLRTKLLATSRPSRNRVRV